MPNRGPSFCGNKECFRFAFWNERSLKHKHLINQQRSFKDYLFRDLNYNQSKQYAVFNQFELKSKNETKDYMYIKIEIVCQLFSMIKKDLPRPNFSINQ